eukprot:11797471-Prorocentrum_lima.AAC.1
MLHAEDQSLNCLKRAGCCLEDPAVPLDVALIGIQRASDLLRFGRNQEGHADFARMLRTAARRLDGSFE